jgi:hypothetical protein
MPENLAPITDPDDLVTKSYVDARYVNVTGDTMTGTLEVSSLAAPATNVQIAYTAVGESTTAATASVNVPVGVLPGDLLVVLPPVTHEDTNNQPTHTQGFSVIDGFPSPSSHVGNLGNFTVGGAWYYKVAGPSDAGSPVTFTRGGASVANGRWLLMLLVVRNAQLPSSVQWQYVDGGSASSFSSGAANWSREGLQVAVLVTWGIYGAATAPTTTFGQTVISKAIENSYYPGLVVASAETAAGPSAAVPFTNLYGYWGSGLLHLPGPLTAASVNVGSGVSMGSNRLTGLPVPASSSEAATKGYVDARTPVIVVLGKTDPLPGGTAVGTVIVRKDV